MQSWFSTYNVKMLNKPILSQNYHTSKMHAIHPYVCVYTCILGYRNNGREARALFIMRVNVVTETDGPHHLWSESCRPGKTLKTVHPMPSFSALAILQDQCGVSCHDLAIHLTSARALFCLFLGMTTITRHRSAWLLQQHWPRDLWASSHFVEIKTQ